MFSLPPCALQYHHVMSLIPGLWSLRVPLSGPQLCLRCPHEKNPFPYQKVMEYKVTLRSLNKVLHRRDLFKQSSQWRIYFLLLTQFTMWEKLQRDSYKKRHFLGLIFISSTNVSLGHSLGQCTGGKHFWHRGTFHGRGGQQNRSMVGLEPPPDLATPDHLSSHYLIMSTPSTGISGRTATSTSPDTKAEVSSILCNRTKSGTKPIPWTTAHLSVSA